MTISVTCARGGRHATITAAAPKSSGCSISFRRSGGGGTGPARIISHMRDSRSPGSPWVVELTLVKDLRGHLPRADVRASDAILVLLQVDRGALRITGRAHMTTGSEKVCGVAGGGGPRTRLFIANLEAQ